MTDQHELMAELMREAHLLHTRPKAIAAYVVDELLRLEGSGEPWIREELAKCLTDGMAKRCAAWRHTQRTLAKTKRGKTVEVPQWAGVPVRSADGTIQHHQLRFEDLTVEQVEASVHRMAKQRNTLSADLSVRERVLAYMREHPECTKAGEAMNALGLVA